MRAKLYFAMVLSYMAPTFLLFAPWFGVHAPTHQVRIAQIAGGLFVVAFLTLWNYAIYRRQKDLDEILAAIRARGPVGYYDENKHFHRYTMEERALLRPLREPPKEPTS